MISHNGVEEKHMKFIVAVDSRWGIGKKGDLLLSIPDDMRYYRETTRGKVVVMGYTTLLSLPGSRPAPARLNLVLADVPDLRVKGAVVCGSMEQLRRMIGQFEPDDVFDVGGGSMYRQLMPYCTGAHITKMRFDGAADTRIPNLDEAQGWSIVSESDASDYEGIGYSFVEYRNSSPLPIPAAAHLSSSMTQYFRKREPLTLTIPAHPDEPYREALTALLTAYFHPLCEGFSAADVENFLTQDGVSFEEYLRRIGAIAAPEDIDAFFEAHPVTGDARTVAADRENVSSLFAE